MTYSSAVWTPEMRQFVFSHWPSMSATEIANALGPLVNKNMVIGIVSRAGATKRVFPALSPPAPELTDADFLGCRFIAGESRPVRPGMFCCEPCVMELDASERVVRSSWCSKHLRVIAGKPDPARSKAWTPERKAKQAARQRRRFSDAAE